jgi:hypothetical protein
VEIDKVMTGQNDRGTKGTTAEESVHAWREFFVSLLFHDFVPNHFIVILHE